MEIIHLELGPIQTNCYILHEPGRREAVVIDPGDEGERVAAALRSRQLAPAYILLTHGHPDHIGGVAALRQAFPEAKVMIHDLDVKMLDRAARSQKQSPAGSPAAPDSLREGEVITCGGIRLRVIHTPGHTPGGVCLLAEGEDCLFAGDTLFNSSVGRTDFPGGSFSDLEASIRGKLYILPAETAVYPGHGPATDIGRESRFNQFVRAESSTRDDIHG